MEEEMENFNPPPHLFFHKSNPHYLSTAHLSLDSAAGQLSANTRMLASLVQHELNSTLQKQSTGIPVVEKNMPLYSSL